MVAGKTWVESVYAQVSDAAGECVHTGSNLPRLISVSAEAGESGMSVDRGADGRKLTL